MVCCRINFGTGERAFEGLQNPFMQKIGEKIGCAQSSDLPSTVTAAPGVVARRARERRSCPSAVRLGVTSPRRSSSKFHGARKRSSGNPRASAVPGRACEWLCD
jgi:hypothetical protein